MFGSFRIAISIIIINIYSDGNIYKQSEQSFGEIYFQLVFSNHILTIYTNNIRNVKVNWQIKIKIIKKMQISRVKM